MVGEDGNLLDKLFDQSLIKLCNASFLSGDEVLPFLDSVHDFFPAVAVELGLFLLVAEPENLIGYGIVVLFIPLTPCWVRPNAGTLDIALLPFQSTRPVRGETENDVEPVFLLIFQSLTPRGVRQQCGTRFQSAPFFMSDTITFLYAMFFLRFEVPYASSFHRTRRHAV